MKLLRKVGIAAPLLHDKDAVLNEKFSSGLADHDPFEERYAGTYKKA